MRKYPSISAVYNRLNYKSKNGYAPVYFRLYYRGKTDYLIMKDIPPVHKLDWIGDQGQSLYVANPAINGRINQLITQARDWSQGKVFNEIPITIAEIKEYLKGANQNETFNQFIDRYILKINKNKAEDEKLAYRTIQTYRSFEVRINEFNPKILFEDITPSWVSKFERWLAVEMKLKGVTRVKHFDKLKICYRAARKEGLVKYDEALLFDDIKIKEEKSRRISLTQTELKKLRDTVLDDERDEFFKNIFLFGCLTGLYYSDIRLLKVSNIEEVSFDDHQNQKTATYITSQRSKNDEDFVVPVFPDTKLILDSYSNFPEANEGELFSGLISDQKFNLKLKGIASQVGITKLLSAKVARHTFAELMVSIGIPMKKVGRALGHTQVSTTEIYGRQSKASAMRGWGEFKL